MIKLAFLAGRMAACRQFKLAGPMGADAGVMPKGDEQSHGTNRVQYAPREDNAPNADPTSAWRAEMPDWLWNHFTTYDHIAPGRAHEFGQEVIG